MGDNGAGKSTLVKIIAGNFPPTHGTMRMDGRELVLHKPIDARQHGIEIVYQDLALCDNLTAAANVFLGRELAQVARPVPHPRLRGDVQARRRAVRRAEIGDAAARSGQADVGRPAPGGGDRPHPAVGAEDRADGRADRGDLGAPGRRGAQPHPPSARPGHRGHPDQPPHARRLRGLPTASSSCGAATRWPTRRSPQSSPEEVTGPDHRRHRTGLTEDAGSEGTRRPWRSRPRPRARSTKPSTGRPSVRWALLTRQTFWVFVAAVIAFIYLSFATDAFFTPGNLFNVTRNFAFVGIIGLGMTAVIITGGIDLSVGSMLCLAGMVAGMIDGAPDYPIWLAIPGRDLARRCCVRRASTASDRLCRHAALCGDARHDVGRAQPRHGDVQQHDGLPVRPATTRSSSRSAAARPRAGSSALPTRPARTPPSAPRSTGSRQHDQHPQPGGVLAVLALIFGFAFRWTRWGRLHLRDRRQRARGDADRRAGPPHQGQRLHALRADGRHRRHPAGRLARHHHHRHGHGHGADRHRRRGHRRRQPRRRHRHGVRRRGRRGADRDDPQQPELLGINPFWQGTFVGTFIIIAVLFDRIRAFQQSR